MDADYDRQLAEMSSSMLRTTQVLFDINKNLEGLHSVVTVQSDTIKQHAGLLERHSGELNELREEVILLRRDGPTNSPPATFDPSPHQRDAYLPDAQPAPSSSYAAAPHVSGHGCPMCRLPRAASSRSQYVEFKICKVCWQWTYMFFKQRNGRQEILILEEYKVALPDYLDGARLRYNLKERADV